MAGMKTLSVIDELCSGCCGCQMACSFAHTGTFSPSRSKIRIVKVEEKGVSIPVVACRPSSCVHLDEQGVPPCVAFCPTGALLFDTPERIAELRRELVERRADQPLFQIIAPWKYPFPLSDSGGAETNKKVG